MNSTGKYLGWDNTLYDSHIVVLNLDVFCVRFMN